MKSYTTIKNLIENEIVIEKSRFICFLKGVEGEGEAKDFIAKIKKQHSLATHNCYAYIADELGLVQKFSDDGEPQGTAGLPMLEMLKANKLTKCVAVVTRYFGGIKLGTGGLARAYGGSVLEAIKIAEKLTYFEGVCYDLLCDYDNYSKLLKLSQKKHFKIIDTVFENKITITLVVKKDLENDLKNTFSDLFKGREEIVKKTEGFFTFN